jgi:two-component system phosphate regulon response regulator PhoB
LEQPEHVHSRTKLLEHIWGQETHVQERTVDVHIRRLRKALQAANPAYSDLIQTVSGTGYRFSPRDLQQ